jgi:hypothetical protein
MQKFAIMLVVAAATLLAGPLTRNAEAATWRGATDIPGSAQNFTPVEPAACRGWGPHCRPGFTWTCRRWRGCWCRPCY